MMTLASDCPVDLIDACLSGDLSADAAERLERHLESCPACREALDKAAASWTPWNDVRSYLQDDPNDLEPLAEGVSDGARADEYERLLNALSPTDDLRMLGRLGPYEIAGIVGAGGMGIVLKAFDPTLARFVAIKVLAPRLWRDSEARARFSREARAVASIVHDSIVEIYGVFESDSFPYFTMPYLRGETLQQRIDRRGPLGVSEILSISRQLAAGLAAAHAQGLVHRDIKPANIFLTEGAERVLITDFGLAKSAMDERLTQTNVLPGTPAFMSPEQVQGGLLDHRSDLFSLGGVMYMMTAGRAPFTGTTTFDLLRQVCEARPSRLEEVAPSTPIWLAAIIDRLHRPAPEDRYQSAEELARDLEECLAHEHNPEALQRPRHIRQLQTRYERTAHPTRVRNTLLGLGGVAIALAIWVGALLLGQGAPPKSSSIAVTGTVVDKEGKPLADVKVLVVQKLWPNNRYQQRSKQTTTDAGGRFEFKDFATSGEQYAFLVTALPKNHAMVSEYRLVRDGTPQEPVTLTTVPAPATRVVLKDESGKSIAGAKVMPGRRTTVNGTEHLTYAFQIDDGGQTTDEQGQVTLHAFLPGEKCELTIRYGDHFSDHQITASEKTPVEVVIDSSAATPQGEPVTVSGVLVDGNDKPIAGETILVVRKRWPNNRYRQDALSVKTDRQGGFTMKDFAPGGRQYAFMLTAIVDGYLMKSEYRLVEDGAQQEPVTLKLTAGENVTFTLEDRSGQPVAGAKIAPMSRTADDAEALNYFLNAKTSARTTDDHGEVQFTAWAAGDSGRVFCTHDRATHELEFTVPESRAVELVLPQ